MWPLTLMLGLVPLWWVLGAYYLIWPVFGLLLIGLMATRGRISLPSGSTWWLIFLGLATASVTMLDKPGTLISFTLRLSFYVTAFVVAVYVYNLLRDQAPWRRVFVPLMLFWLSLVILGWFGVFAPRLSMTTPVEIILPQGLTKIAYVRDLVHLKTAEFNPAALNPTLRPSAPYPYTNNWGSSFALLVPCVVAYVMSVRDGLLRKVLLISLPLSLPPAFFTLNRGMFVSLGAGLAVLAVRSLLRGNFRLVLSIVGLSIVAYVATLFIPVGELIEARTSTSDSTTDRLGLYEAALNLIKQSPLLGFGAPATVDTTRAAAPVGTQGQFWLVMISHGIPALVCFIAWFVAVMIRTFRAVSPAGQWLSTVPIIALVQLPFYGLTFHNLTVAFFAVSMALAAIAGPVNRPPVGAPRTDEPLIGDRTPGVPPWTPQPATAGRAA